MDGGDPYARMVGVIRGEAAEQTESGETDTAGLGAGPVKMRIGRVYQRKPLIVIVAGIKQPAEVFKINERLTRGARRKVQLRSPVRISEDEPKSPTDAGSTPAMVQDKLTGTLEGPVKCPGGHGKPELDQVTDGHIENEKVDIYQAEEEQLELDLEKDDLVLLLTEDDQVFYIICKVVSAV